MTYKTVSLVTASTLLTFGIEPTSIGESGLGHDQISFEYVKSPKLESVVTSLAMGDCRVNPKEYHDAVKIIRNMMSHRVGIGNR